MEKLYVTREEGRRLQIDSSCVQSWHHDFSFARTRNEALTIRWYLSTPPEDQKVGLEILILLAEFRFADREQIRRMLEIRRLDTSRLDPLLDEYVRNRILNVFTLAVRPLDSIPEDALQIFCTDCGARHILIHFHQDAFVYWQSTDNLRNAGQVARCLSTLHFFLSLLQVKQETLRVFEPFFDVAIGRRTTRFSAYFEIRSGGTARRFFLESVRSCDLPTFWRRKVSDQIRLFLDPKCWQQVVPEEPVFLLLCESLQDALEASAILCPCLGSDHFRVTLDSEVARGMDQARFFRYTPSEGGDGTFTPVRATIFARKDP